MGSDSESPLDEVEADVIKTRIRFAGLPDSFWLMSLVLVVVLFAAGIRLGGINVPLDRIPWSVLVPCMALFCFVHSYIMLGLHRALFYNEHDGTLETFRPYASPDQAWLEKTAGTLAARHPAVAAL